ncbi:MAG TPA: DUF192 domain-containing protein [Vicinamibacterales bacterium]|nr:DUF192 domain-containing protein [Vicinamibacterales bacterium]
MAPGFLKLLVNSPDAPFSLRNTRNGRVVAERLEPAFDSGTRRRGLMGRDGLPAGSALVIAPSNSVHTFFMKFPIDVLFVAKDGQVLKIRPAVGPWRITGALRGFAVIELPAGAAAAADLRVGDRLEVVPAAR